MNVSVKDHRSIDVKECEVPGSDSTWKIPSDLIRMGPMADFEDAVIPTEYFKSLGLPTLRWTVPAYAFFASPALRSPDEPLELFPPECYWLADARTGRPLLFAQCSALPFAVGETWGRVTIPNRYRTMEQFREDAATIDALLRELVPSFFTRERREDDKREHLRTLLERQMSDVLMPQYRALTPDFFEWVEA